MARDESHNRLTQEDASHGEAFVNVFVASLLGFFLNPLFAPVWGFLLLVSPIAPRWAGKQVVKAIEWTDQHWYSQKHRGELNSKRRIRK
jgi:hypothetical protein